MSLVLERRAYFSRWKFWDKHIKVKEFDLNFEADKSNDPLTEGGLHIIYYFKI